MGNTTKSNSNKNNKTLKKMSSDKILGNAQLINKDGSALSISDLKSNNQIVALYFSAHWCPPCRGFTPKLSAFYNEINQSSKKMEIIFISHDKDEAGFKSYYDTMPWAHLKFDDANKKTFQGKYATDGIPTLTVFKVENGELKMVSEDAYEAVGGKGPVVYETWVAA